jgi:hypothetical protein
MPDDVISFHHRHVAAGQNSTSIKNITIIITLDFSVDFTDSWKA